ncbi:MAG: glycosyltransferase family 87 protein [Gemmatimonadota bacterium]
MVPLTAPPLLRFLRRPSDRWIVALLVVTVLAIVVQQSLTHVDYNFEIFRRSFRHLAAGRDLYVAYPDEQVDLFKYSPTFALLFLPFATLPTLLALALWDGLNVGLLWFSMRCLLPRRDAQIALAIMYLEIVRTTQRAQSNALVTALMVLAFVWLEERQQVVAVFAIVVGTSVKLFPALAIIPAIFHPRRARLALVALVGGVVALLLPLVVTSPAELLAQYRSWGALERLDAFAGPTGGAGGLYGGVMHWVRLAFHVTWPNLPIQLAGLAVLLAPLARVDQWELPLFRLRLLASILLFCTIFNHQVESPSFVIAMAGTAIWFVSSERRGVDVALLAVVLVIVSLGTNDVMPDAIRDPIIRYKLKTLPVFALWIVVQSELFGLRRGPLRLAACER